MHMPSKGGCVYVRGSERVYDTRACVYHKVISSALVYVCPAGRVYVYAGVKVNRGILTQTHPAKGGVCAYAHMH